MNNLQAFLSNYSIVTNAEEAIETYFTKWFGKLKEGFKTQDGSLSTHHSKAQEAPPLFLDELEQLMESTIFTYTSKGDKIYLTIDDKEKYEAFVEEAITKVKELYQSYQRVSSTGLDDDLTPLNTELPGAGEYADESKEIDDGFDAEDFAAVIINSIRDEKPYNLNLEDKINELGITNELNKEQVIAQVTRIIEPFYETSEQGESEMKLWVWTRAVEDNNLFEDYDNFESINWNGEEYLLNKKVLENKKISCETDGSGREGLEAEIGLTDPEIEQNPEAKEIMIKLVNEVCGVAPDPASEANPKASFDNRLTIIERNAKMINDLPTEKKPYQIDLTMINMYLSIADDDKKQQIKNKLIEVHGDSYQLCEENNSLYLQLSAEEFNERFIDDFVNRRFEKMGKMSYTSNVSGALEFLHPDNRSRIIKEDNFSKANAIMEVYDNLIKSFCMEDANLKKILKPQLRVFQDFKKKEDVEKMLDELIRKDDSLKSVYEARKNSLENKEFVLAPKNKSLFSLTDEEIINTINRFYESFKPFIEKNIRKIDRKISGKKKQVGFASQSPPNSIVFLRKYIINNGYKFEKEFKLGEHAFDLFTYDENLVKDLELTSLPQLVIDLFEREFQSLGGREGKPYKAFAALTQKSTNEPLIFNEDISNLLLHYPEKDVYKTVKLLGKALQNSVRRDNINSMVGLLATNHFINFSKKDLRLIKNKFKEMTSKFISKSKRHRIIEAYSRKTKKIKEQLNKTLDEAEKTREEMNKLEKTIRDGLENMVTNLTVKAIKNVELNKNIINKQLEEERKFIEFLNEKTSELSLKGLDKKLKKLGL